MKNDQPLFDPATHYRIEVRGRVDMAWLKSYDSSVEVIIDESKMTDDATVLDIHTDQTGIVGLVRRLHGLGMTIQKFQIISKKEI